MEGDKHPYWNKAYSVLKGDQNSRAELILHY